MSIDGANLGVLPAEAVKAVLGGKEPKEKLSKSQMLEKIMAMPEKYADLSKEMSDESYEAGCLWLAKQFYLFRKDGKEGDAFEMYEYMITKCGKADYDFTGFMVGYANNLSRWLMDKPEQANPAILTIGKKEN